MPRMKSISSLSGRGSSSALGRTMSVVPTTTLSCQGTANSTRPSEVLGYHDGVVALQEFHVEHQVHALARSDHLAVRRAVHVHDVVHEAPCGVHHAAGLDCVFFAREVVHEFHAAARPASSCTIPVTLAWFTTVPPFSMHVCARLIAMRESSNLPVVVYDAALESLFDRSGDVFHYFFFAEMNFERP